MMDDIKVITTSDGSSSLYLPQMDETYHSTHGALAESQHVYINTGLKYLIARGEKEINLFELGLGTGLNAILTYLYSNNHSDIKINYTTIEKYPIAAAIVSQLNFEGITDNENVADIFKQLHNMEWAVQKEITEGLTFAKYKTGIEEFETKQKFNLIYYDAFAPSKQPEMWDLPILERIKNIMQPNGILVTYCAQGQFKRNLKQLDFELDMLQGPKGKAQITRAILTR